MMRLARVIATCILSLAAVFTATGEPEAAPLGTPSYAAGPAGDAAAEVKQGRRPTRTPQPTGTPAPLPDLTVSVVDTNDPASASGDGFAQYEISVANQGTAPANGVKVIVQVPYTPSNIEWGVVDSFWNCATQFSPNGALICTGGTIGPDQRAPLIFFSPYVTDSNGTVQNTVTATARVDPDENIDEIDENNNVDSEETTVVP